MASSKKKQAAPKKTEKDFRIIGIGASAGGLEALQVFFRNVSDNSGHAFVVIQHLSPDYKSMMDELLSRHTNMDIAVIEDGVSIKPNTIYLIPPRKNLKLFNNQLFLTKQDNQTVLNLPIDIFFRSLADEKGKDAIGIILSGTGSDGTMGTRAIKEKHGMVMVQNEGTAKFNGMPASAISTGLIDYILPPEDMGRELDNYLKHPLVIRKAHTQEIPREGMDAMSKVVMLLKEYSGIDFSYYKENTINRRLERRISINRFNNLDDYLIYLEDSDHEKEILYREFLIGVTQFFRDKEAYSSLEKNVLENIFSYNRKVVRAWTTGCSTGEEAYSIAIQMHEVAEKHQFKGEIKIFASDIDKRSIDIAGKGFYPDSIIADIDPSLLIKYFSRKDDGYQVNEDIRNSIVFATHNVLKDPPFSKLDMIVCRNLFIYLKPEIQSSLLSRFYYSLLPEGYLFMGNSETLGGMSDAFEVIDQKNKIYKFKKGYNPPISDSLSLGINKSETTRGAQANGDNPGRKSKQSDILSDVLNDFVPPSIIVDSNYYIINVINNINPITEIQSGNYSNELFSILPKDLGLFVNNLLRQLKNKERNKITRNIAGIKSLKNKTIKIEGRRIQKNDQFYFILTFELLKKTPESTKEQRDEAIHIDVMSSSDNKDLKSRIEQVLSEGKHDFTELEVEKLIETVNVYHVELEYQNDELRRIQHELENSKARYASLFKYAPIGYVICNDNAEIEAVNKSFLSLVNRKSIEKYEKFSNYVAPLSQDQFYLFYKSLINNRNPDSIEIHLSGQKEMIPVKLEANIFFEHDRLQTRLTITDLTTQKNYEQQIEHKSWELGERLKELNCIHEITKTTAITSIPTEEIFNKVLEVIPGSFQYPEITVAEIEFQDKKFFSSGYRDYKQFIKAEIRFMDEVKGAVIVGLTKELPESESPFLPDEEKLIASIAEILSKFLQKRRSRKMLMQSELQLNKGQEISKTGSWTFHLDSGKVSASPEAYRIYGLDPEKPLSIKDAQKFSLPEYRDMLDERLEKLIKYNDPYDVEFQIQQPGGKTLDIHSVAEYDPEANIVTGFLQDISEQKENLQRIKLLSRSIEQNPVAIVITDNKGNIDYVNPAFSAITGYNTEEVIGQNPRILKSGYQDKEFYIDLWKTITSGKDWFGIMKNRKKNGDFYWEEAIISPIVDENGRITNFVAVKEDISERKKLMEDLVKAKEKAEESDHLKSAFLANMSHEIRTPMNGILGFTNLLKKPDLSSEKKDKFIDIIHSSGKRMLNTVNDIVEISKIEAGLITNNFEEANILTRVEEIVQFFQEEASEKGIIVEIDDEKNLPEKILMVTDPRKFDGILINLVKNAIKFTKAGSVAVELSNDEHNLHLAVKDTGMGIPKERQKAIFNRFEQAENTETRKFEGSGLGLAITTSYVEILKGKIWLESEVGKGSTFYVSLPMNLKPD